MPPASDRSLSTITVSGHGQGPKSTHVETADAEFVVGKEASPLEYLLGSLAACVNVIGHMVAKDRGIVIEALDVEVAGDIDPGKYKGDATEPRAGFQALRVRVSVDADDETMRGWLDEVAERCPVADNLANAADLDVALDRH